MTMKDEDEIEGLLARVVRQAAKGKTQLAGRLRRIAIARAKRAIQRKATPRLWIMLGDLYTRLPLSEACYRSALELDPENGEAAYELAWIAYWRDRFREAERLIGPVLMRRLPQGLECIILDFAGLVYRVMGNQRARGMIQRRLSYWRKREPKGCIRDYDPDWDRPDPLEHASLKRNRNRKKQPAGKRDESNAIKTKKTGLVRNQLSRRRRS